MPYYLFEHPKTKVVEEIFFHMNDEKIYIDDHGVKWNRIYVAPNAAIDTQADPWSAKDFSKVTNKKGTLGTLQDQAAEMSEKRAQQNGGVDPIKEQYYENYSAKRGGLKHPDIKARDAKEKLKKLGVEVKKWTR